MGIGIQIKKPDRQNAATPLPTFDPAPAAGLPPLFYLMLVLTFPATLVALYFFFQTRSV